MKTIHTTVSLETFTSRIPGIIPAFDKNGIYHVFTKDAIAARNYQKTNNYGMIPINVSLADFFKKNKDASITENNISFQYDCMISYRRLDDWFFFFTKYYDLLNNHGTCSHAYKSAVEYYDSEVSGKYSDKLLYGNKRSTYEDMDKFFVNHAGKVVIKDNDLIHGYNTEELNISKVAVDDGLFKYIKENFFLQFYIPAEYKDFWNTSFLWFGDAIKWNQWFSPKMRLYGNYTSHEECVDNPNCCECEEYFKRGGNKVATLLQEWVNIANDKAEKLAQLYELYPNLSPISIHSIPILQSIENMGEMSIFSNDWIPGVDYRNTQDDTKYGTVVIRDGIPYILKPNDDIKKYTQNVAREKKGKNTLYGFKFDEKYLERVWGNDNVNLWDEESNSYITANNDKQWITYTDYYIESHNKDFYFENTYLLKDYKGEYKKITSTSVEKTNVLADRLNTEFLPYSSKECVCINNVIYPVFSSRYVKLETTNNSLIRNKIFLVEKYRGTGTEYIKIGGSDTFSKNGEISGNTINEGKLINYNGEYIIVDNNEVKLKDANISYTYPLFDAHTTLNDIDLFVKDKKIYTIQNGLNGDIENGFTQNIQESKEVIKDKIPCKDILILENGLNIVHTYELEDAGYITGYTDSKIDLLKPSVLYYDDIGNEMHGLNPLKETKWSNGEEINDNNGTNPLYAQPVEGTVLTPYYNINSVTNLTVLKGEKYEFADKMFNGNLISNMAFYCTNKEGKIISDKYTDKQSINAINKVLEEVGELNDDKHIMCDITYHINATLMIDNGTYVIPENYSDGVTFKETVEFVKKQEFFNTSTTTKILVWYYDIVRKEELNKSDLYGREWSSPKAQFSLPNARMGRVMTYVDMDTYNDAVVLPLFREEYRFGSAAPQSTKSNIYIDRGINYAFDKHIKLGEVSSFEALENYSNGFFNIIDS